MIIKKDAAERMLLMLITAVATVLITRLFLEFTNYFQLSSGEWHIAHVLFGGILMTAGMMLVIMYDWEKISRVAMVVFGIGLGWFIDEIGKFLSKSNDYFFQPAVVVIYGFFIGLFLVYKLLDRNQDDTDDWPERWIRRWVWRRWHIGKWKITRMVLGVIILVYIIGGLWDGLMMYSRFKWQGLWQIWIAPLNLDSRTDLQMLYGKLAADVVTAVFFGLGWRQLIKKHKMGAIRLFQIGLLVNIFFGQVFKFYLEQMSAVFGLLIAGGIYFGLNIWKRELKDPKILG